MVTIMLLVACKRVGGMVCGMMAVTVSMHETGSVAARVVPESHGSGGNRGDDQCDYETNHEKEYGGSTNWRVKEKSAQTPILFRAASNSVFLWDTREN